jgi:hypothetical protein
MVQNVPEVWTHAVLPRPAARCKPPCVEWLFAALCFAARLALRRDVGVNRLVQTETLISRYSTDLAVAHPHDLKNPIPPTNT